MDGPGCHHDRLGADRERVIPDVSKGARRHTAVDRHAPYVAVHDDARAPRGGILQIGEQGGLLGPPPATHAAVATGIILRTAPHIPWQQAVVPAELREAADQDPIATRWVRMV